MFTACSACPSHTSRAASRDPPAINADASYIPGNTGSSLVPRPKPSNAGLLLAVRTAAK